MIEPKIEITALLKPFIDTIITLNDEVNNLLQKGYSEYLESHLEKFLFTYNFLHRNERVNFKDYYYPITVKYKNFESNCSDLTKLFEQQKYIIISGRAGSGKSTLIKNIFINCISTKFKIPILIELRRLNESSLSFNDYLKSIVSYKNIKPNEQILNRTLDKGAFLIILDGFDELIQIKRSKFKSEIEDFIDKYFNNYYIITTRPGAGLEYFPRFATFLVRELGNDDVEKFIRLQIKETNRQDNILKSISTNYKNSYYEYLKSPLLLSMFILAFENHPEIPKKKSVFYRNVFDTLYSSHDSISKSVFLRERSTKLERENFETILCYFSFYTFAHGISEFTQAKFIDILDSCKPQLSLEFDSTKLLSDFLISISIFIQDGFEYRFIHKTMHEYFVALFISKLPEKRKNEIYQIMGNLFVKNRVDLNYNFFDLCNELDEINFQIYFVKFNLESFLDNLGNTIESTRIDNFFALFQPSFVYYTEFNSWKIFPYANIFVMILDFCKIKKMDLIEDFIKCNYLEGSFNNYLEEKDVYYGDGVQINLFSENKLDIYNILDGNLQFSNIIDSIIIEIINKIDEMKRNLENNDTKVTDFLTHFNFKK